MSKKGFQPYLCGVCYLYLSQLLFKAIGKGNKRQVAITKTVLGLLESFTVPAVEGSSRVGSSDRETRKSGGKSE
jgi:hypothetical protein